jgi:hypothetical protein
MMRAISPVVVYCLFALASVLATYPVWRLWIFGLTIDELLRLRCIGL